MNLKKEKELLNYMNQMEFTDILGLAAIIGTEIKQDESFEDFITNLIVDFDKLPRTRRRQLLKLAKDVAEANQDIKKGLESQSKTDIQKLDN